LGGGERLLKKRKFLIGGIIIIIAIGFLAVTGFLDSNRYYYTVSEAAALGSEIYGRDVKVNGTVEADSVKSDVISLTLTFTVFEGNDRIPVVFHGVAPDNFKLDADVVVEGEMDPAGVLQADNILTKCPSKYVPEE
jgi:cytochrome c-type biogenesis protein CcmE